MVRMKYSMSRSAFSFASYDFIGFDLDHTLCSYNLKNLFANHFTYLTNHLRGKGYDIDGHLTESRIDFISRGLLVDVEKGNLLKIGGDGGILRASHGTKKLSCAEIEEMYGAEKKWTPVDKVIQSKLASLKSNPSVLYGFDDFTEVVAVLVYALAVDSARSHVRAFQDVLSALHAMYTDSAWEKSFLDSGTDYINPTPKNVVSWIQKLRQESKIALITSNYTHLVPKIAGLSLGPEWKDMFDVCIYNAGKPRFFKSSTKFLNLNGNETNFEFSGEFERGSMHIIQEKLKEKISNPRCLYLGDSPSHDYVHADVDCVAIIEELKAERPEPNSYLSSNFWGSYLYENGKPTLFGKIAVDAAFYAPSLQYFADKPIDYKFKVQSP